MQDKSTLKNQDSTQTTIPQVDSVLNNENLADLVHNIKLNPQHLIYPNLYIASKTVSFLKDKKPVTRKLSFIGKTDEIKWILRDPGLKNFEKSLRPLYPMQELDLEFCNCDAVSKPRWARFCEEIHYLKSLRHISVNFTSSFRVSNKALKNLGKSLESLPLLQTAVIIFSNVGVDDEGVKEFSKSLKTLAITDLTLDFSRDMHITDKGLKCLSKGLKRLKTLKSFILNLEGLYKITAEGVSYLSAALKSLPKLLNLQLRFKGCHDKNMDNQALLYLSDALQNLTLLQSFGINFNQCGNNVTDVGFKELVIALKNLTSMKQITLEFFTSQISNIGLATLKETLMCLTQLRSLTLDFSLCRCISSEGITDLGESLQYLPLLQLIYLNFDSSANVTDGITKHFNSLTSLRKIYLIVRRCTRHVTDVTLRDLGQGLKSIKSLQFIQLNFTECWELTDEGLMEFARGLATITSIRTVFLIFAACQKMTMGGVRDLCEMLKKITSLGHVYLDFKWCKLVSHADLKALNEDWNSTKAPGQVIDIQH